MESSWVRRTLARPMLCQNCDEQCWGGDQVYVMLTGELYCEGCPPDDIEDDSIEVWVW